MTTNRQVVEGVFFLTGKDFVNAGSAASGIKKIAEEMGIGSELVRRIAIAAFEAEMNTIIYAVAGIMRYVITQEMVRVTIQDMGPGIEDIALAMTEGFSTAPDYIRAMGFGSGMGLPNIKKNADELTVTSTVGEGTTLDFTVSLAPAAEGGTNDP